MGGALSIAAAGLVRTFRGGFRLDVPALDVAAGSTLAVLGPSGSGKSTLLAILALLERPDAGRVLLDGREVSVTDRDARRRMAAVFQRPFLFKGTVGDNVGYGLRLRRASADRVRSAVRDTLARVGLEGWEKRSALTLSGGEAQRVALARALVLEPQVLLLDEPLASLDAALKRGLTSEFADILRREAMTVVYVTHDQDEAVTVADSVAVMREGSIVAVGPTDDVTGLPPDAWTARFFGLEPALGGTVVAAHEGLVQVDCSGVRIAAIGSIPVGQAVRLGVRPEDVLLMEAGAELPRTSARNHLRGTVIELSPRGATRHVVIDLGGPRIASSVSRAAVTDLGLEHGAKVLALFKATAVRIRAIEKPS